MAKIKILNTRNLDDFTVVLDATVDEAPMRLTLSLESGAVVVSPDVIDQHEDVSLVAADTVNAAASDPAIPEVPEGTIATTITVANDPIALPEPIVAPVEPVAEVAPEPAPEPVAEPAPDAPAPVEATQAPVEELVPEPAPVAEPVVESVSEPVAEVAPVESVVAEPAAESVVEEAPAPEATSVVETVEAEPVSAPAEVEAEVEEAPSVEVVAHTPDVAIAIDNLFIAAQLPLAVRDEFTLKALELVALFK